MGYASSRVKLVFREIFDYEADLIVLYIGHNEFLEENYRKEVLEKPHWILISRNILWKSRIYLVLREPVARIRDKILKREENSKSKLELKNDLLWTEEEKDKIFFLFELNLKEMLALARAKGIKVVLISPASNLLFPPFRSKHKEGFSEKEELEFEQIIEEVKRGIEESNCDEDIKNKLKLLISMDSNYALSYYLYGRCLIRSQEYEEARRYLEMARDLDSQPIRAVSGIYKVLQDAKDWEDSFVIWINAQELFDRNSKGGIAGYDLFLDHCHPDFLGQTLIAQAVAKALVDEGIISEKDGWQEEFNSAIADYRASLPQDFFAKAYYRTSYYSYRFYHHYNQAYRLSERSLKYMPDFEPAKEILIKSQKKIIELNPPSWE